MDDIKQVALMDRLRDARKSGSANEINLFHQLCFQYFYHKVFMLVYGYLENREDAMDAVSEVFLRMIGNNIRNFPSDCQKHLENYILKSATNLCITLLRKKAKIRLSMTHYQERLNSLKVYKGQSDPLSFDFDQLVATLPKNYQIVINLWLEGFNNKEMAEMLDTTERAIANRLLRGRKALKKVLEIYFIENP